MMNRPIFLKIILYGFTTYAAVFMLWSVLWAYGFVGGLIPQVTSYVVTAFSVYIAARMTRVSSFKEMSLFAPSWAIIHILLDLVYILPAAGIEALSTSFVLIGYVIVLVTPFVAIPANRRITPVAQDESQDRLL